MLLTLLTAAAISADLTVHDGWLIEAEPNTYTSNGVGAPTVIWNAKTGLWTMFFEAKLNTTSESCPRGQWVIGTATSIDGITWTVAEEPLISPSDGSYYSCVAAHPNAVVDKNTLHLFFKAEQRRGACDDGVKSWGCGEYTGVGYYRASLFAPLDGEVRAAPALVTDANFGYPAVTKAGDDWWMFLSKVPALHVARSTEPDEGWVLEEEPIISPGEIEWTDDRVFNPAVACRDDDLRFHLWVGGKSLDESGTLVESGLGDVLVPDGHRAYVGLHPTFEWPAAEAWRHWDVLRAPATNDWLMWFSERDEQGRNRIGMASTRWPVAGSALQQRSCGKRDLVPVSKTDAQAAAEQLGHGQTSNESRAARAAGCSSTGGGSAGLFVLGLLGLLTRRRREV